MKDFLKRLYSNLFRKRHFEFYCPNCNAVLDTQKGFDPNGDTWVCIECGQFLYGDMNHTSESENVVWYCDNCGDILNKQPGFSDINGEWICTKCGFTEHFEGVYEINLDKELLENLKK